MKILKYLMYIFLFASMLLFTPQAHAAINAKKGDTFYTLFSLYYEGDHHLTTNYRKGVLVPINTQVTFVEADDENIVMTIAGKEVNFVNVEKYSGENIDGIFNRTFGKKNVSLERYGKQEKNNILCGNVEVGMSKKAVILALGYPPKHQTPSLSSNQWRYWQNRFNTFLVYFVDDKVSHIKD